MKGYLNGARISKALNMSVLVAKVSSAIFAVSSSLPVGPEGPMIHAGSMIGEFFFLLFSLSFPSLPAFFGMGIYLSIF